MLKEIPVENEILTREDVAKILRCNTRTITNMQNDGRIPKPFYLGERAPRWRRQDLMAWLERLANESQAKANEAASSN